MSGLGVVPGCAPAAAAAPARRRSGSGSGRGCAPSSATTTRSSRSPSPSSTSRCAHSPSSTGSAPPPGRDRLLFLRTERRESLSACPRFCGTYLLESTAAGGVRASWQRRICICGWCSRRLDCVGELGCLVQWGLGFRSSAWIKRRKRRSVVLVRSDFGVKCEVQCRHFARTANFPNSGEVACLSDYGPCHSLDSIPNLSGKASPTHLLLTQFSPHFGIFLLSKCLSMDIIVVIFALFTLTN